MAWAALAASSLAHAQSVGASVLQPDEWAWPPGVEETTPASDESTAEGSTSAAEQPPLPPAFGKLVLLDAGHVLSSPVRWRGREWLVLSASAAALATMSLADESLSDAARDRGPAFGSVGDALNEFGSAGSLAVLGGFYLAGAIGKDSKAKDVCVDGVAASLIATGMITPVLSTVIGRERPTEENGAYSFKPFDGRSFPSGHATQAFAVASVIATSYDQLWVKATVYGAASLTAWGRVRRGKHFPTDVVAGAAIGTLVGRSVVHFNRKLRSGEKEPEITGARLTVLPLVSGGTWGVSATLDF
jgi:hypothetical protein